MKKETKFLLIALGVLIAGWLAWSYFKGRQAGQQANNNNGGSITSGTGSNLNSVAPALVGGGTAGGTYAAPGAVIPVTVTVDQSSPPSAAGQVPMQGVNAVTPVNLTGPGVTGSAFPGTMMDDANKSQPQPPPVDNTQQPTSNVNIAAAAPPVGG